MAHEVRRAARSSGSIDEVPDVRRWTTSASWETEVVTVTTSTASLDSRPPHWVEVSGELTTTTRASPGWASASTWPTTAELSTPSTMATTTAGREATGTGEPPSSTTDSHLRVSAGTPTERSAAVTACATKRCGDSTQTGPGTLMKPPPACRHAQPVRPRPRHVDPLANVHIFGDATRPRLPDPRVTTSGDYPLEGKSPHARSPLG